MCRKNHLQGYSCLAFGLGMLVGHSLESWILCLLGGFALMSLGFCIARQH